MVFSTILNILDSQKFLFCASLVALVVKSGILAVLLQKFYSVPGKNRRSLLLLLAVLVSSITSDIAWVISILKEFSIIPYWISLFCVRTSWGFFPIQYHALSLFLVSLVQRGPFRVYEKMFFFVTLSFALFFWALAFVNINCHHFSDRPDIELTIRAILVPYIFVPLLALTVFTIIYKLRAEYLPRILKKQLILFIKVFIIPLWISEIINMFPWIQSNFFHKNWDTNFYLFNSFSIMLLTGALYYAVRAMMGLRFLNFQKSVQSPKAVINAMNGLADSLDEIGKTVNVHELQHLTRQFFSQAFRVPLNKTTLYIYTPDEDKTDISSKGRTEDRVNQLFVLGDEDRVGTHLRDIKILVHDEIAFTDFYEETDATGALKNLVQELDADIFVPIYKYDELIACIIVDRDARAKEFYNNVEQDEMRAFAKYLGKIIHLLQSNDIDAMKHKLQEVEQEKRAVDLELYDKHQQINQYKESVRQFARMNRDRHIGILYYKGRRFTFGNQAAKELVDVNLQMQEGHPITKALKQLVYKVEQYKASQTLSVKTDDERTLVLSAMPNMDSNSVIIMAYRQGIADVLKNKIELLANPSEWDYLLYLETTQSGKLVNQLIPSSGEQFLNFKIALLKAALSKKATLLDLPESDVMPTVELIHHISLRETVSVVDASVLNSTQVAMKLFGVNGLIGGTPNQEPLLAKLDGTGTLLIKHIHLLDKELQEQIAQFIRYGTYCIYKTGQQKTADVRVICSSSQNLAHLMHQEVFSKQLYDELRKTTLVMPSLLTLSEQEFSVLTEDLAQQAVQNKAVKKLFALSEQEKNKLIRNRAASMQELKERVRQILLQKTQKSTVLDSTHLDPAYELSDPDLAHAARLGKHALRDEKVMTMLWNKFGNQNKIADFLGVNRSSVNRRCKEYNLQ